MRFSAALATLVVLPVTLAMPSNLRALQALIREEEYMEKTCLRGCYDHEPRCLEHMHPEKLGDCWTCCEKLPDRGTSPLQDLLAKPIEPNRACVPQSVSIRSPPIVRSTHNHSG
ncbi:hypothetical protein BJY00DRAFT_309821 [Aspergillus carlsbadensis]|nr:hypothetical protein BJY00DRAFT_309821 [Aspergillus carlsbadensis]